MYQQNVTHATKLRAGLQHTREILQCTACFYPVASHPFLSPFSKSRETDKSISPVNEPPPCRDEIRNSCALKKRKIVAREIRRSDILRYKFVERENSSSPIPSFPRILQSENCHKCGGKKKKKILCGKVGELRGIYETLLRNKRFKVTRLGIVK